MLCFYPIFNFNSSCDLSQWKIVDDIVMGGHSRGTLSLNNEGNGVFKGRISLADYGGFSSVRLRFNTVDTKSYKLLVLRFKGDGKQYQVRIKANASDNHSYASKINTTGQWQTIKIPLNEMKPVFRGRTLNLSNFHGLQFEEVSFLIANRKAETFQLIIDRIELE